MYPTRRYGAAVRANLIAMRPLSSPTLPSSLRQDLEMRILVGESISVPRSAARGVRSGVAVLRGGRPIRRRCAWRHNPYNTSRYHRLAREQEKQRT
jgi:hypothetical protein